MDVFRLVLTVVVMLGVVTAILLFERRRARGIERDTREMARGADGGRPVVRGPQDDPALTDDELVAQRTRWFKSYTTLTNVIADRSGGPYTCPACGHPTLSERGQYEICDECDWEDDGQDDHDADVVRGGPNGGESLTDARTRYVESGGTPQTHRPPSDPV